MEALKDPSKNVKNKKKPSKDFKSDKPRKNTSVYISGLPLNSTLEEMASFFGKCGIIMEDLLTGNLRIKVSMNSHLLSLSFLHSFFLYKTLLIPSFALLSLHSLYHFNLSFHFFTLHSFTCNPLTFHPPSLFPLFPPRCTKTVKAHSRVMVSSCTLKRSRYN